MKEIIVNKDSANQRLDKFLAKYLNAAPKSFIYKMLRKKNIKLNSAKAQGLEILAESDTIQIFMADETINKFRSEKKVELHSAYIDIVFEDENILICNKPRGLLTHPGASSDNDTMLSRILAYLYKKGEYDTSVESVFTPGLCNRLDRNTTGIIVCAKTLKAAQQLNKAISSRESEKFYKAIVIGEINSKGALEGYLTKDKKNNIATISDSGEKSVLTEYTPICAKNGYSLLKIKLITGRSHQIRAHLSDTGHPILGDGKYGGKKDKEPSFQMLHSQGIKFFGLKGELKLHNGTEFSAPPPEDFLYYQHKLFGGAL